MWFTAAQLDPKLVREQQIYYDELRATFDDPLPLPTSAEFHPLMIHNQVARNKAKQAAVLGKLQSEMVQEKARAKTLAQEFTAQKDAPKPGQPGYKPGQQPTPGQPIHTPPQPPPNVPGTPGYDPNKPETPPSHPDDPQRHEDRP